MPTEMDSQVNQQTNTVSQANQQTNTQETIILHDMLSMNPLFNAHNKFIEQVFNDPFDSSFQDVSSNKPGSNNNALSTRSSFAPLSLNNWFNFDNDPFFKDVPVQSQLKVDEHDDKYVVTLNNVKNKEFKVDFHKNENSLSIVTSYKAENKHEDKEGGAKGTSVYTSSSSNSYAFDKKVKFDEIRGDVDEANDLLVISVPKLVKDTPNDNVVRIAIENGSATQEDDAKNKKSIKSNL